MKNTNGYYNEKTLAKFSAAYAEYVDRIRSGELLSVSISSANSKMGAVASVSTLPFITCPACCRETCGAKCYAAKLANLRPNVLASYAKNTALALYKPETYWAQVKVAMQAVRYFRFHVSGDIINGEYFAQMVQACRGNPHCQVLCFTKRFNVVNAYLDAGNKVPENLHILFSGWSNLTPENPHGLPETNVIQKGAEPAENWKICGGNCFNCACRGVGCWQAGKGDTIAFPIH